MRNFRFNPTSNAPVISALVAGPRGTRKVRLVFDTGAEITQLHAARMHEIGYSAADAVAKANVVGIGGVEGEGYVVKLDKLFTHGAKAENFNIGVFDMQHLLAGKVTPFLFGESGTGSGYRGACAGREKGRDKRQHARHNRHRDRCLS